MLNLHMKDKIDSLQSYGEYGVSESNRNLEEQLQKSESKNRELEFKVM